MTRRQSGRWLRRWRAGIFLLMHQTVTAGLISRPAPIRVLWHCLWSRLSGCSATVRCGHGRCLVPFPPPACLLALCCIVREFGAKPRTQLLCAVLCLLFVPIPMYASFVYGTLPAPAMVLWGGYGLLRFIKGGKPSWLALPFVLFPLAVLAYQSALIFIIAVCIVAAFSGFGRSGKQLLRGLVLATLLLAVPVAVENIGQSVFFSRVPIPYSTGMPASATVLMGIHSGTYYGPGGFDGSSWNLFWDNNADTTAANAAGGQRLGEYWNTYLHNPKEVKFSSKRPPGNG